MSLVSFSTTGAMPMQSHPSSNTTNDHIAQIRYAVMEEMGNAMKGVNEKPTPARLGELLETFENCLAQEYKEGVFQLQHYESIDTFTSFCVRQYRDEADRFLMLFDQSFQNATDSENDVTLAQKKFTASVRTSEDLSSDTLALFSATFLAIHTAAAQAKAQFAELSKKADEQQASLKSLETKLSVHPRIERRVFKHALSEIKDLVERYHLAIAAKHPTTLQTTVTPNPPSIDVRGHINQAWIAYRANDLQKAFELIAKTGF